MDWWEAGSSLDREPGMFGQVCLYVLIERHHLQNSLASLRDRVKLPTSHLPPKKCFQAFSNSYCQHIHFFQNQPAMQPTTANTKILQLKGSYALEAGSLLSDVEIAYHTYGKLSEAKDNVIWVCHALTANSDVFDWWSGLFGEDDLFNPKNHFIVCANILGSCYGTTNALSFLPQSNKRYFHEFPDITIRDIAGLHKILADYLKVDKVQLLIGGSMGGHQALEWALLEPDRFVGLSLIATSAIHSPWGLAFNASQRMAIANDSTWSQNNATAGIEGMKVARSIALLSYRNFETYEASQTENDPDYIFPKKAAGYQQYQGDKLARRFHAFAYWTLSKAMDSMNAGRGRGGLESALSQVKAKTLVITLENDLLFPKSDQAFLARHIPSARHVEVPSLYGHDGFLIETKKLTSLLKDFIGQELSLWGGFHRVSY